MKQALAELEQHAVKVKILGAYPIALL
ncbi:hypothetical protein XFLM_00900 [Xylella fastidiosa subsp. fastidiosa GB514]|nr:hypothetical protein XFLM_00900 [Xylella fastidiosa subsp. fastidiosa GB514]